MPAQNATRHYHRKHIWNKINPLWWKAMSLLNLWQGILTKGEFEKPLIDPNLKKATCLLKMWRSILTKDSFRNTVKCTIKCVKAFVWHHSSRQACSDVMKNLINRLPSTTSVAEKKGTERGFFSLIGVFYWGQACAYVNIHLSLWSTAQISCYIAAWEEGDGE